MYIKATRQDDIDQGKFEEQKSSRLQSGGKSMLKDWAGGIKSQMHLRNSMQSLRKKTKELVRHRLILEHQSAPLFFWPFFSSLS